MYFINDQHKQNYKYLTTFVFKYAKYDKRFHSLAYVIAVDEIYQRCIADPFVKEFPFVWTVKI